MVTAAAFAGKAVAIPAISFLLGKAFGYLDKHRRSEGMEELKNRLELAMPKIQAVFDVVNPDRITEQSHALDAWLWQLRGAVEDAENTVDELEYYELEEKADERKVTDWGSSLAKMKHNVVRSVKNVSIVDKTLKNFGHRDTLKRLRKAVEGLDRSAADVVSFLSIADRIKGSASTSQRLVNYDDEMETSSELTVSKFVGREKEKEKIIGWITRASVELAEAVTDTNTVPIISVVGHGGMGKTTLAQSICKEDAVQKNFEVIWVTVSTNFSATSVTSKILESITKEKPSSDRLEPLQKLLKEKLKSKNFLLVLDDVWEDKKEAEWAKLFAPLRHMKTGSKILLTTRMQSVAVMATNVMGVEGDQCLKLQELEKDENIELFNHHVSCGLDPQDWEHFKSTGEQIVRKLGGCPLVTKVIAGHLRGNTIEYWNKFLYDGLEHLSGSEEGIMRVLRLSYYNLPTELQICFRYCCIFPQDYEFEKKELIQMWMGSGLISHLASGSQTFEDIGERIFFELKQKSFFDLKFKFYADGRIQELYVMHDLMHDLARNVSSGECARIIHPAMLEDHNRTVRHMCIANIHSFSVDEVRKISNFKYLRTIIIDECMHVTMGVVCALETVVESSKFLRLFRSRLDRDYHYLRLTDKCGKLIHLRYLRLQRISSEGICGVVRLYHLMLLYCDRICARNTWQNETKKVLQVRYLGNLDRLRYVSYAHLGKFPLVRLTHLQELNGYWIQDSINLSAIKSLRTLRTLQLNWLHNVKNPEEAKDFKLNEVTSLNSLSLRWLVPFCWDEPFCCDDQHYRNPNKVDELVLDQLQPHCNVRELRISGYTGIKVPFWIEDLSIKNLVSLILDSCFNWERLPSLRKLVWLKSIKLYRLVNLQQIGHSSNSNACMEFFLPPRLEILEVHDCPKLFELPVLPRSLVFFMISEVGLTKLPMIDSECSETKSAQLIWIHVNYCDSLTSLEGSLLEQTMYMGALQDLIVANCNNLESGSIAFEGMNRLKVLNIRDCPKLSTIGTIKGELSYLNKLNIIGCFELVSLPAADVFRSFKLLRHMEISGCKNLLSLGGLGSLPFLDYLCIRGCSKLVEVEFSLTPAASSGDDGDHLVQIQKLLVDLPPLLLVEPLKRLRRTTELHITQGSQMESLPERWLIQNREFLRCLTISGAKSLKSLPLSMQELSSLEELCIYECHSELLNEIRENSNSELNKVSHIRNVEIEFSSHEMVEDWFSIMGKECDRWTYRSLRDEDSNVLTSWLNQPNDDDAESSQPWWRKYQCCLKKAS